MALFSSGSNAKGQLGFGDVRDRHQFHRCSFDGCEDAGDLPSDIANIIQIASGSNHTLLLAESADNLLERSRSIWVTGDGSRGQLGPKNRGCEIFHKLDVTPGNSILLGYTPVSVAALWETSFVVLRPPGWKHGASDAVIAMGANDFGDLGVPASVAASTPMGTPHIISFDQAIRSQRSKREPQSEYFRIRLLETGLHHVVAILDIHATDNSSVRQCLVGWGAGRHGQLHFRPALETNSSNTAPRRQNGTQAFLPVPTSCQFEDSQPITSLALGQQHSAFLCGGTLFVAGSNKKGQLDLSAVLPVASAVHCTWNGTYVICRTSDTDWQVQATGSGNKGQLGVSGTSMSSTAASSSSSSAVPQSGLRTVSFPFPTRSKQLQSIACGSEHVLAVLSSDEGPEVWGWGWNEHGNLGLGHTNDVNVPVKIWPGPDMPTTPGVVVSAWAGCGTSWVFAK